MPMGTVWKVGSWIDGSWADGTWADAVPPPPVGELFAGAGPPMKPADVSRFLINQFFATNTPKRGSPIVAVKSAVVSVASAEKAEIEMRGTPNTNDVGGE